MKIVFSTSSLLLGTPLGSSPLHHMAMVMILLQLLTIQGCLFSLGLGQAQILKISLSFPLPCSDSTVSSLCASFVVTCCFTYFSLYVIGSKGTIILIKK